MIATEARPRLSPVELGWSGPAVVAIGGGHGLAQLLEAVQQYAGEITAVVTVADDGGSSGRLISALEIIPPGDLRRCLLALSPEPTLWRELFGYRFDEGDVAGHSLGNLILTALTDVLGDFPTALRAVSAELRSIGQVVPVALRPLTLEAEIDGETVAGQHAISKRRGELSGLRLEPPDEPANPEALEAIVGADQIILGPGSLYTSVLPALMVPGVADAIKAASARVVYVCNLVTQDGETLGMDAVDHVEALLTLSGLKQLTAMVANRGALTVPEPIEPVRVDPSALEALAAKVVLADLVDRGAPWPQHDPIKLGQVLAGLT